MHLKTGSLNGTFRVKAPCQGDRLKIGNLVDSCRKWAADLRALVACQSLTTYEVRS